MISNTFETVLSEINNLLEQGVDYINKEKRVDFTDEINIVTSNLNKVMQEGRLLRIGIVGEVKAGKSSFLNAVLFDGNDILPKAPTPMTAALTRISYGEQLNGHIVFYDKNDWDVIESRACQYDEVLKQKYNEYKRNIGKEKEIITIEEFENNNQNIIPMEYRACKEVQKLARSTNIDIKSYLGTEKEIGSIEELNDYVGSNGKYTPIVKYTELRICNEMLKGVEVIDTPGLNDPIYSRSRTTKKFLVECDAVFLLGYGGQYLGADDMSFLLSTLPNEGIQKAVLVVSKFDATILQFPAKSNPSFKTAYLGTKNNCEKQARDNISACDINCHNEKLINQIKESLPPICTSSLAYSAAKQKKKNEPYGKYENLMINNLKKRFPDFSDNYDVLMGLSNIPTIKEDVFEKTRIKKDEIINDRIKDFIKSQKTRFINNLDEISREVEVTLKDLKNCDYNQLEQKYNKSRERLDSVRKVVEYNFEKAAVESSQMINEIASEVSMEMGNHEKIEVRKESNTIHHQSTSGILFWKKENHWDEIINTNIVELYDIEHNIETYRRKTVELVNNDFKSILRINDLKNEVKKTIMGAFEQVEADFDEDKILLPLENALKKITIPELKVDMEKYYNMLGEEFKNISFNGMIKNENIPEAKRIQFKVLRVLSEDLQKKVKEKGAELEKNLKNESKTFIDKIGIELEEKQENIKKLLENKKENMDKMELYLMDIQDVKAKFAEIGD